MFPANSSPSEGLLGTNPTQNKSSDGNSSQRSEGSLLPPSCTVDYANRTHIYRNREGKPYACITGILQNCSLEELRIKDYFNTKRNLLPPEKKEVINKILVRRTHEREYKKLRSPLPSSSQSQKPTSSTRNSQLDSFFGVAIKPPKASGCQLVVSKPTSIGLSGSTKLVQANSTTSGCQGLFGSTKPVQAHPTTSGSIFGTSTSTSSGLFESTKPVQTNPTTSGCQGPFGSTKPVQANPTASGSIFGTSTSTPSGLFGSTKPVQANAITSGSISGTSTSTPSGLFESTKPVQTNPTTSGCQGLFGSTKPVQANPITSGNIFGTSTSTPSGLFGSTKPAQTYPVSSKLVTRATEPSKAFGDTSGVSQSASTGLSVNTKPVQAEKVPEKNAAVSNAGSFSYEVNKMVLVSSFVSLLQNHKVSVPGNLLDNTDFAPQLFKFLEQYNMNLPTANIPQFQLSTLSTFNQPSLSETQPQSSSTARNDKVKKILQEEGNQKSQEEKSRETEVSQKEVPVTTLREPLFIVEPLSILRKEEEKVPKEEVLPQPIDCGKPLSMVEPPLSLIKEEEEKIEIQGEKSEVQNKQLKDEGDKKEQKEDLVDNSESGDVENGFISIDLSPEDSGDEGAISIPKDC